MSHTQDFNDREIDATFRGESISPELAPVAEWADALRQASSAHIDESLATSHLMAAMAAVTETVPVGQSESAAPTTRTRRRFVLSTFLSTLVGKMLAGGVALATVTGGVAATGALPDAVQDPIANAYEVVGFDFPTSDDVDDESDEDVDDADDGDTEDVEGVDDSDTEDVESTDPEDDDDESDDDDDSDDDDESDDDESDDDDSDSDDDDESDDDDDSDSDDDASDDDDDSDDDDNSDDDDDSDDDDSDDTDDEDSDQDDSDEDDDSGHDDSDDDDVDSDDTDDEDSDDADDEDE